MGFSNSAFAVGSVVRCKNPEDLGIIERVSYASSIVMVTRTKGTTWFRVGDLTLIAGPGEDLDAHPLTRAERAWLDEVRRGPKRAPFEVPRPPDYDPSADPFKKAGVDALRARPQVRPPEMRVFFSGISEASDRDPAEIKATFTLPVAIQKVEVTGRIENLESDRERANRLADRCQTLEDENRTLHAENSRLRRGLK